MTTAPPPPISLLTPAQVATRLAITPDALATLRVRGGGPPFVRVGGAVRYHPRSLARWVAEHETTTTKRQPAQAGA